MYLSLKKLFIITVLFLQLFSVASISHAAGVVLMNLGYGGSSKTSSYGFDFGGTTVFNDTPLLFEIWAHSVGNTDDGSGGSVDASAPHSNTHTIDMDQSELGFLLKTGYTYKDVIYLIGGGVSNAWVETKEVSNVTGIIYNGGSKGDKLHPQAYAGLLYRSNALWERGAFEIGFNTRRGVIASAGFAF